MLSGWPSTWSHRDPGPCWLVAQHPLESPGPCHDFGTPLVDQEGESFEGSWRSF